MEPLSSENSIYPPQFARRLSIGWSELDVAASPLPKLEKLTQVLEIAYQASFLKEESEPIRFVANRDQRVIYWPYLP
jgi:hypothetical protein